VIANLDLALKTFDLAKAYITSKDLAEELEWQRSRRVSQFTETDLLREAAWVILCSGFRESIVRRKFDHISLSFCDWESAGTILESAGACRASALASIKNTRKIDAILGVTKRIDLIGFPRLKEDILSDPIGELQKFPFIGPITCWHLAKNLGFEVAKPDRHLVRLCTALGFLDVQELCKSIAKVVGEAVHVVDITLWRYSADRGASSVRHSVDALL
jgi:hypothetical protein